MSEDNWTVVRMTFLPRCDFCEEEEKDTKARYDGKTVMGTWAFMCPAHYSKFGMGLGAGVGQYLKLQGEK